MRWIKDIDIGVFIIGLFVGAVGMSMVMHSNQICHF